MLISIWMRLKKIFKYKKLVKKLFGDMGDLLTDTYSEDWKNRDMGFIGKLDGRLTDLERRFDKLELLIKGGENDVRKC